VPPPYPLKHCGCLWAADGLMGLSTTRGASRTTLGARTAPQAILVCSLACTPSARLQGSTSGDRRARSRRARWDGVLMPIQARRPRAVTQVGRSPDRLRRVASCSTAFSEARHA